MEQNYDTIALGVADAMDAVNGKKLKAAPTAVPPRRGDEMRVPLLIREYTRSSENFDFIYQGSFEHQHHCISVLAAATFGQSARDPRAAIRLQKVMGQIIDYRVAWAVPQRFLSIEEYSPEHLALVATEISSSVLASLSLPTSDQTQNETRGKLS